MYGALWVVLNSKMHLIWLLLGFLCKKKSITYFLQHHHPGLFNTVLIAGGSMSFLKACCQSSLPVCTAQAPEDKNTPKILLIKRCSHFSQHFEVLSVQAWKTEKIGYFPPLSSITFKQLFCVTWFSYTGIESSACGWKINIYSEIVPSTQVP